MVLNAGSFRHSSSSSLQPTLAALPSALLSPDQGTSGLRIEPRHFHQQQTQGEQRAEGKVPTPPRPSACLLWAVMASFPRPRPEPA
jgi:hypothetical protein